MGYDINSVLLGPNGVQPRAVQSTSDGSANETFPATFTKFLVSAWFWPDDNLAMQLTASASDGTHYYGFNVVTEVAGGTTIQTGNGTAGETGGNVINFSSPVITTDTYVNILCSCDVSTNTAQLYINDVAQTISSATWNQATMTSLANALFGLAGNPLLAFTCLGDVYIASTAAFFDLAVTANRRKFIDGFGYPVDLGSNASGPTGTSPQIYLSVRDAGMPAEMLTNRGTGGADFVTDTGAPLVMGACVELPLPPVLLACGPHTTTTATFEWSPNPFGGTPDHYDLQYRAEGNPTWTIVNNIAAESYTATGLATDTVYEWQVAALRDNNPSDFSNSYFCATGTILPVQPVPPSLLRWRGQVGVNWKGMALVGDAFAPVIGLSDFANFTEYGNTMEFLVTSPPIHNDRKRIFVPRFEIEVEAGDGIPDEPGVAPLIWLDYSKDGGVTWSTIQLPRSMGLVGEYIKRLRWIALGASRTWVFRLRCTDPVRRYIIGTYLDDWKGLG